jgi:hypothetical protein
MQAFLRALQLIGACGRLSVLRVQNGPVRSFRRHTAHPRLPTA